MLALSSKDQSFFVGLRNTFYRCGSIFGQGVLVMLAGLLAEGHIIPSVKGNVALAWALVFYLLCAIFIGLFLYHSIAMPKTEVEEQPKSTAKQLMRNFLDTVVTFFRKPHIGTALFFILTYRLGESQLGKIAPLFVLASPEKGGLGFHFKWDMGWMNDTLKYMKTDFPYRPYNHNLLTFSMMYAFGQRRMSQFIGLAR